MRIALVTDDQVIRREGSMLRRVAIGLLDEGASVVSIEPRSVCEIDPDRTIAGGPIEQAIYEDRGLWLTRALRAERVAAQVSTQRQIDVVHAVGVRCWGFALAFAKRTGAALIVDIHSRRSVEAAGPFVRKARAVLARGSSETDAHAEPAVVCVAADPVIAIEAQRQAPHASVHTAAWGVHRRGEHAPPGTESGRPVSVCVLGEARHPGFVAPALEGLARVGIEAFVFIDEEADAKGSVWTLADKLGLRERIDLVPSLEENRELALRCDALLVPGPANRHRSVVLDAMAAGVAVAASRDPYVHVLNTPGLAWLVEGTAPEDWADQITGAITPGSGRDRRLADARRFVDEERSPSRHIESLQGIYQGVCDPDPIAFQTVASA